MKKLFSLLCMLVIVSSCKKVIKDINKIYPVVKTVSAEVQPDGSVKVTGEVISQGDADGLKYIGFCMDTVAQPGLRSNQAIVYELYGNQFTYTYTNLDANKTYYFRAWATNINGYDLADNDIVVKSTNIDPNIVPCTPPQDSIVFTKPDGNKIREKILSVSEVDMSTLYWRVSAYSNSRSYEFLFGKIPTSGIYKTVQSAAKGNYVAIMVDGFEVDGGSNVYVKQLDGNRIQISICEAKFWDGFDYTFTTRIDSK